jgi:hypothetical protein
LPCRSFTACADRTVGQSDPRGFYRRRGVCAFRLELARQRSAAQRGRGSVRVRWDRPSCRGWKKGEQVSPPADLRSVSRVREKAVQELARRHVRRCPGNAAAAHRGNLRLSSRHFSEMLRFTGRRRWPQAAAVLGPVRLCRIGRSERFRTDCFSNLYKL